MCITTVGEAILKSLKTKRLTSLIRVKKEKMLTPILYGTPINQLEKDKQYSRKMGKL